MLGCNNVGNPELKVCRHQTSFDATAAEMSIVVVAVGGARTTQTLFDAFWRFASPPTFATHANFFSSEVDTRRWKKDQLQIKAKETKETFFGLKIILQKRICCNVFKCLETDDTVRHMPGFPIDFLANNIIICENIFLIGTFPMSRITPAPWQSGSPVHEQVELVRTKCIFSTICSSPQNTFSHFQFYQ